VDDDPFDLYIAELDEPKRSTLTAMRDLLDELLPEAEHAMSYGVPAFKIGGKAIAGLAAQKDHLSYLPHSGDVIASLGTALDGYETTKGTVKFAIDTPLPRDVVATLVAARRRELGFL
jgi:uncharacterized protein YdhG (YjbR/CyaY superfamily)